MNKEKILGAMLATGLGLQVAHGVGSRGEEESRDKAVCGAIAQGQELTRDRMPKRLLGDRDHVHLSDKGLDDQVSKCHDLGIEVARTQAAKAVVATLKGGQEQISSQLIADSLNELEGK